MDKMENLKDIILHQETNHYEKKITLTLKTINTQHTMARINKFILNNDVESVSAFEWDAEPNKTLHESKKDSIDA